MSASAGSLLRDESGQALVFIVLALGVLITVVALVMSVGNWLQTRQNAQSVADAAALAGVQDLPDDPSAAATDAANSGAQNGWAGAPLETTFPDPTNTTIQVVAHQDVSGFFAPLAGLFDLTIQSSARARVGAPTTLTDVVPIALPCYPGCTPLLDQAQPVEFDFRLSNPPSNPFVPVRLTGMAATARAARTQFMNYVKCDAAQPLVANCLATAQTWPVSYQALPGGFTTQPRLTTLCNDLNNGLAGVKLFPVFDNGPSYHVIGWAAGTYTVATTFQSGQTGQAPNVCTATPLPPPIPPPGVLTDITLNITFQAFNLSSTSLPTGGGAEPTDFGVRAIALTG